MKAMLITSWYPNFNGGHFGLPPSSIHRMTGLGGKMVWTMTYAHSPHWQRAANMTQLQTCTLPQRRHRSQPTQSIIREMFLKCALISSCGGWEKQWKCKRTYSCTRGRHDEYSITVSTHSHSLTHTQTHSQCLFTFSITSPIYAITKLISWTFLFSPTFRRGAVSPVNMVVSSNVLGQELNSDRKNGRNKRTTRRSQLNVSPSNGFHIQKQSNSAWKCYKQLASGLKR